MKIQVAWELEIPDKYLPKLIEEAKDRGLGPIEDYSPKEIVRRLMIDGGEDIIQSILQDPARVIIREIK